MKLADIMVREVVTVSPEDTSAAAAARMRERNVGCLVVSIDGAVKGILTDRDLLQCLSAGHDPRQCKVLAHMSKPVIVERPEEELLTAAGIMAKYHIKRLPIVAEKKLVGLISFSDIARIAYEQAEGSWPTWSSIVD